MTTSISNPKLNSYLALVHSGAHSTVRDIRAIVLSCYITSTFVGNLSMFTVICRIKVDR